MVPQVITQFPKTEDLVSALDQENVPQCFRDLFGVKVAKAIHNVKYSALRDRSKVETIGSLLGNVTFFNNDGVIVENVNVDYDGFGEILHWTLNQLITNCRSARSAKDGKGTKKRLPAETKKAIVETIHNFLDKSDERHTLDEIVSDVNKANDLALNNNQVRSIMTAMCKVDKSGNARAMTYSRGNVSVDTSDDDDSDNVDVVNVAE